MRTNNPRIASLLLLVSLLLSSFSSAEMIKWTTKSVPNFDEVRDAAYGNETYVAVGDNNTLLYSNDGLNWSLGDLPPGLTCNLKSVAFAFGQFFAGGSTQSGSGVLLGSMDGVSWSDITNEFLSTAQEKSAGFPALASGIAGGKEVLAAAVKRPGSWGDAIALSGNGSVWKSSGYSYSSERFFVDSNGSISLLYSYSNGEYAAWSKVSADSSGYPSLSSWSSEMTLSRALVSHAVGNSTYVGVGPQRKLAYYAKSSWSVSPAYVSSPAICDYTGVAFGRDTFVAVGTSGAVVLSYDLGRSWRRASVSGLQSVNLNGIRYVGDLFIAYGGGRIITGQPLSKREWSTADVPSGAKPVTSLASNGQRMVAVGDGGQIFYSATGASWSKAAPATSRDLYRVVYDAPTRAFYATGAYGTLLRSANGVSWQTIKTPGSGYYNGVGRAGSLLFAAGGTAREFLQSRDGKTWTTGKETLINFSGTILGDGGAVYVFGPSGKLLIKSGNAKNWLVGKGAASPLSDLTVSNRTIFATATNGRLFSTSQAKPGTWKSVDTRTSGALNGIAPNSGPAKQVAAVGQYGLVYSEPARGKWRLEMLGEGAPELEAIIKFKNRWVVAGAQGGQAFIGHTDEN
jgi:hypothetical protein